MALAADAAWWFMLVHLPLGLATIWTDLSQMKIPNWITDTMLVAFLPLGLIALPWADALWQLAHPAVLLGLGLLAHALRLVGAGDIKYIVAASPYVMRADWFAVLLILSFFMVVGFVVHRLARRSPLRALAPEWQSWHQTGRFPLGFALAPAMLAYLALAATG